ncbi:hypothetical protein CD351_02740 [Erythrobacter sp. KY5]|uniref:tetratricopeptide repeat protein n=1 Tax=Erythrobacter sp. KY5 TaxID=2011159 RepID=UPI000DBF1654|nr:tetratricopeptide repeat protein [Erythrobacter sp. KY5]AWW73340.1 hypothetical protein CD351_02740 [Erythrobacter sp. KY5]
MALLPSLLVLALQVGPNPNAGALPGVPDELLNRPPRPGEESAAQSPESAWLAACLEQVTVDPARAHTLAQLRRNETTSTNRILANHCLGLAATELSLWNDAITAFKAARDETPDEEMSARARFGTMAGNAALASGDIGGARAILEAAKRDAQISASAELQSIAATDLARTLVELGESDAALAELETAITLSPDRAEGWLLKATLLRRLERLDEAQLAIERAGQIAPTDPQIGLEAGVIAVLAGRDEAARASWQSVIDIAPGDPAALSAQDYLSQLGPPPTATSPQEPS